MRDISSPTWVPTEIGSFLFNCGSLAEDCCCRQGGYFYTKVLLLTKVARWFVFESKIQIWVNFGGSCNRTCWHILWTLGPFYGLLLHFMDVWYSLWKFGIFYPVLVFWTKKNLATLLLTFYTLYADFVQPVELKAVCPMSCNKLHVMPNLVLSYIVQTLYCLILIFTVLLF
jgi:hypothetical protein